MNVEGPTKLPTKPPEGAGDDKAAGKNIEGPTKLPTKPPEGAGDDKAGGGMNVEGPTKLPTKPPKLTQAPTGECPPWMQ